MNLKNANRPQLQEEVKRLEEVNAALKAQLEAAREEWRQAAAAHQPCIQRGMEFRRELCAAQAQVERLKTLLRYVMDFTDDYSDSSGHYEAQIPEQFIEDLSAALAHAPTGPVHLQSPIIGCADAPAAKPSGGDK